MRKLILLFVITVGQFMAISYAKTTDNKIDRYALVSRHNVKLNAFDKLSPLSVGNGKFTFTCDLTGLQTFPSVYSAGVPLTTMAEWGWHSLPKKPGYQYENTLVERDTFGRMVTYPLNTKAEGGSYFRANPHQSNLVQLGFILKMADGTQARSADIATCQQTLELWKGILESHFKVDGQDVHVETFCHPRSDMIVVNVTSDLITADRLALSIKFPYANGPWGTDPSDWKSQDAHTTKIVTRNSKGSKLLRQMDAFSYYCTMKYSQKAELSEIGAHTFTLTPSGKSNTLQFCMLLTMDGDPPVIDLSKNKPDCIEYWKHFWSTGGAIDLSGSIDPRWRELERRIVLSQYLNAIQSAQKYPPQETGLTCNSWHGKFHLEMHWWHGVHFALWDRSDMLERSMDWYREIMPAARELAKRQGYEGIRWPKMVGPNAIDSPSGIGPLLIWQQPHPIYYAELIYRRKPTRQTLAEYKELIFESAKFMADYAHWNADRKCFELGPPVIPAREFGYGAHYAKTKNPAYELAYWAWGLDKANQWRQRLGQQRIEQWDKIAKNMAPLPIHKGVYVEAETPIAPDGGHPCMLAAYGLLPETYLLDKEVMRKTLDHVMANWNWSSTWGWDYPMIAMTAARLGEGEIAIDALLKDVEKNLYLRNGHNFQSDGLPIYLPGNGGLLTAVAMMAGGWDGCPDKPAPGFPDNGKWVVKYEGFKKMP